jgi:non-specific protein-tyrosine kinase
LAYSYQQNPVYKAESRLLIKPIPSAPQVNVDTEGQVVASEAVASLVLADLGLEISEAQLLSHLQVKPVTGQPFVQAEVLAITSVSGDADLAAGIANSFATSYIDYRQQQAKDALDAAQDAIQEQIDRVRARLADIAERLRVSEKTDSSLAAALETERSVVIAQLGVLQQRLDDTNADPVALRLSGGDVLELAVPPSKPISPDHVRNGASGLGLGLMLGVGLAFLRERLDDRFRTRREVEAALAVPVLATINKFETPRRKSQRRIVVAEQSSGAAGEAFRNLRTNLEFTAMQQGIQSILITSPSAHEGKTATTANLASAFSIAGRKVVVVSGDLRRPTLEMYLGSENKKGLSEWLLGDVEDVSEVIHATSLPGVQIVPSGGLPHNPAELLTSIRLPQLVEILSGLHDVLLIDSPPVLPVADATIIGAHVGGTVLVLNASTTKRSPAIHAKEQLERVNARVIGSVLNGIDLSGPSYYYQPYYYSGYKPRNPYSESSPKTKPPRRRRFRRRSSSGAPRDLGTRNA